LFVRWFRGQAAYDYIAGNWDEAFTAAEEFIAEIEAGSPHYLASMCYSTRALIRLGRGDVLAAVADSERALDVSAGASDPQNRLTAVALCSHVFHESGNAQRAVSLVDEALAELGTGRGLGFALASMHTLAWTSTSLGRARELRDALARFGGPWAAAATAFTAGDLRGAADITGRMGARSEEARNRIWLAQELAAQRRRTEAAVEAQRALAFYRSVGATHYIREAEALLAATA
jgi:tetratricopeptide (TPR) repeat protein